MLKIEQKKGYKQYTIKNEYLNESGVLDYSNVRELMLKYKIRRSGLNYEKIINALNNELIYINRNICIIKKVINYSKYESLLKLLNKYNRDKKRIISIRENLYNYY